MYCYNCQHELTKENRCRHCGADVRLYKLILSASNLYYNDGLRRAKERDLSGAIDSLQKSLKCNKENTAARNLLGLVYYECGDVVNALSEWVLSRSFAPVNNPADRYIHEIQQDSRALELMNQTIKKYNQALSYCKQGSYDLAILQLKKVLASNPKLLKGHQLLALLYYKQGEYDQARYCLRTALHIDSQNALTKRYIAEVKNAMHGEHRRRKEKDSISYQSGNDTIIRPTVYKERSPLVTIFSVIAGAIAGAAVVCFLVIPGMRSSIMNEASETVKEANSTLASRNATVNSLQEEIDSLQAQIEEYETGEKQSESTVEAYQHLLSAYVAWTNDDEDTLTQSLDAVDEDRLEGEYKTLYETVSEEVNQKMLSENYKNGVYAYNKRRYDEAIECLTTVVGLDAEYENGEALYYLGMAYEKNDDNDNALLTYEKIVEKFEGTSLASKAQDHVDSIKKEQEEEQ
jgi:tetratricopeptide (TPR) repeat protein